MKCSECLKEGKKSFVNIGGSVSTAMADDEFYDKEGNYHLHSLNTISTSYSCSNGHEWVEGKENGCPSCDFNLENTRG